MNIPNYQTDTTTTNPEAGANATAPNKTKGKTMAAKKKAAKKKAAKKKAAKAPISAEARAKIVSKTWADPKVAAARASHHAVKVGGETYRSVLAAFEALKLPIGRHIPFRKALKAEGVGGSLTFEVEDKDGKTVKTKFTLVELPKAEKVPAKKKAAKKKAATPRKAKKAAAADAEQAPATA